MAASFDSVLFLDFETTEEKDKITDIISFVPFKKNSSRLR